MNPQLTEIAPSLIRALNAKKRPGDIDLGLGEPTLRPSMAPFEAATEWVREHGCPYTPNAGTLALRNTIATHYAYPGLDHADNICVTVGSQEALYLAVKALCDPATDEVLVVGPSYPAYPKIAQMEGVAVRTVDALAGAPVKVTSAPALSTARKERRFSSRGDIIGLQRGGKRGWRPRYTLSRRISRDYGLIPSSVRPRRAGCVPRDVDPCGRFSPARRAAAAR